MSNIIQFPMKKFVRQIAENEDPTGLARRYEQDFGLGSWQELENRVLARYPYLRKELWQDRECQKENDDTWAILWLLFVLITTIGSL